MKNDNHSILTGRVYTAPKVVLVDLLSDDATLLDTSLIEDYDFNEIV